MRTHSTSPPLPFRVPHSSPALTDFIQQLYRLIEEGGDWDRRNRLKVYRGLHLISIRQFKRGGELFIDGLSTFTATELISYNDFVALTIISNTLALKRVDLKKKVSFTSSTRAFHERN